MTEAEWLECTDLERLLRFRAKQKTDRKLRLWACACCQRVAYLMVDEGKQAIGFAESFAEGHADLDELVAARAALELYRSAESPEYLAWILLILSEAPRGFVVEMASALLASEAAAVRISIEVSGPESVSAFGTPEQAWTEANASCVGFLRDILGNPFRKVKLNKRWRTDTAVSLARQMYDAREFSAMPILADALQDAGCDNDDILNHCRGGGPHVRGCWVVDMVLGKA